MELTKPQQTLFICLAFISGVGYYLLDFNIYLLLTFLVFFFSFAFKKKAKNFSLVCLAVFILGSAYTSIRSPKPDALYSEAPAKMTLTGQIISNPQDNLKNRTKFNFKTDKGKTLVTIYDYKRKFDILKNGDVIKVYGTVKRPYKATNWGQFDYEKYLNNKGVFTLTQVSYKDWEVIKPTKQTLTSKIMDTHAKFLQSPKLEVLGGMVFGDYAVPTPDEIEDEFIKAGLLHLLAASGLNVGIIFGIWFFLASKLKVPFKPKIVTGMLLVALYSLMTGLPPSVTRAALMLEFLLFGKLLDRKADSTILLVVICALMLLFNPLMLANVGFQLSFAVTIGLLLYSRYFNFWSGIFLIPFVAQLFALPIQAFHFNTFAIYSVFTNIAVMPFISIISFSGFMGSIFSLLPFIGEKICFIADKIADPFIFLLLFISNFVSKLPESLQYLPIPEIPAIIAFYAMLILFILARKQAIIAFFVLIILLSIRVLNRNLEIVVFDVGQGDSILISTPDNRHILVDTGNKGSYSPAKTAIVPYLRDKGINTLDVLVLTHPDSDHIGGAVNILEAVKVNKIYHNGVKDNTKIYYKILELVRQKSIKFEILQDKESLNINENMQITAIKPDNINESDDNEDSIMLYLSYKNFSALLMADCEADSFDKIDDIVKKPVSLLKVGHHGSKHSVDRILLEYIRPEISVISVGERGYQWGHPNPEVISLLEEFKSKVFRTDKDCAVKIITDGIKTDYETY